MTGVAGRIDYADREAQAEGLAVAVADALRAALSARGRASLALPGGTTPAPFLRALARQPLDWAAVTAFPADERWVPIDHPRSNAGLIRANLARDAAAAVQIADLYDPEFGSAEHAEGIVAERLAPLLPPDVVVLGMGGDLHTASLFPGAPRIAEALSDTAPPVISMDGPDGEPRISLSLPALRAAGQAHLLLTGDDKRVALDRALALPPGTDPAEAPILALLPVLTVHWAP